MASCCQMRILALAFDGAGAPYGAVDAMNRLVTNVIDAVKEK